MTDPPQDSDPGRSTLSEREPTYRTGLTDLQPFVAIALDDMETMIYDRRNDDAWIQSSVAVSLTGGR